jgi:glycosyltransferase involved in cell wall biosynthesis
MDHNLEMQRVKTAERKLPQFQVSNKYAGLSPVGLVADNTACGYFRVINPLHMLKMHGADVEYGSFHSGETLLRHDKILVPRQHNTDVLEMLHQVWWEDKDIIYEIDDDLDHVSRHSPAYYTYHPGSPELKAIPKFMRMAHGLTVTTPELARWYYRHNRNVVIIENYIDYSFRDWAADVTWSLAGDPQITLREPKRPDAWQNKTVIGWSGGSTHQEDVKLMGPAINSILKNTDSSVLFAFYGSYQMYEDFVRDYQLPADRVDYVAARHFLDFPEGLQGFDIGLAPITCDQFNMCKSFLRCEELMAVGAAVVASHVGPYARFARRHPGTVLSVGQGKDCYSTWVDAIGHLLNNPQELKQRKAVGRKLIADEYSLEGNIWRWPAAWEIIHQQKMAGNLGPPPEAMKEAVTWFQSYGKAQRNDSCPCGSGLKYKACCAGAFG